MLEENAINCEPQRYPKISNDLLRSAHQSGLQEMKVIILVASKLPQNNDEKFDPFTPIYITREDAVKIGFNPSNVARDLRIACSNLRAREVAIPTPLGDKVTGWVYNLLFFKSEIFQQLKEKYPTSKHDEDFINQLRLHNLLETLPFVMKSNENLMARIIMHPDVVPFLVELKKNYTQVDLLELAKLTDSIYSFRIFLLMMEWKSTGVVHKKIDELRKEFMLQDKYDNAKDLRKWVIETAITEISEKTDWQASYTLKKTGRKFTHLEIKFKKKAKQAQIASETPKRDQTREEPLKPLTEPQIAKYSAILCKLGSLSDLAGTMDYPAFANWLGNVLRSPESGNQETVKRVFKVLRTETDYATKKI